MAFPLQSRLVILQWAIGLFGSWLCVWLFGPWFVNSILVRVYDDELQSVSLREGDRIRWRSEGWATTMVGPHGLPGWRPNNASTRIVVWGDSQVEGFCVNDDEKIASLCIRLAAKQYQQDIDCLPMGRSGSDAADWARTIERADRLWTPAMHVWVVTELSDLIAPMNGTGARESSSAIRLAKQLGADAFFQAARKTLLDPETASARKLRWTLGPHSESTTQPSSPADDELISKVSKQVTTIDDQLDNRLLIVYAPAVPRIMDRVVREHPDDAMWSELEATLQEKVSVIDLREIFYESWNETGRFTRGFHNGTPSYGHLNREGNRIIARSIVDWMKSHEVFVNSGQPSP